MAGTAGTARFFDFSVHLPVLAVEVMAEVAGGAAPAVVGEVGDGVTLAGAEDALAGADADGAALLGEGLEPPETKAATAGPGKV